MVRDVLCTNRIRTAICYSFLLGGLLLIPASASAQNAKGDKAFQAVVTDAQGMETDVKNIVFYWEEKISETAFVPHELKQVPVKRGSSTVNVKFDTIRQIEAKPTQDKGLPTVLITLSSGKTGEFGLALAGSFKGDSDFGEVEFPANGFKKIIFK
jgi:hypothetical protein